MPFLVVWKSVAVSDTLNGVGLLIGGLAIPFLALIALGEGSFFSGLAALINDNPEYLTALTQTNVDNKVVSVPWPTLLTGMMFIQVFYWSTNQVIVQRAMAAKKSGRRTKGCTFCFSNEIGRAVDVVSSRDYRITHDRSYHR